MHVPEGIGASSTIFRRLTLHMCKVCLYLLTGPFPLPFEHLSQRAILWQAWRQYMSYMIQTRLVHTCSLHPPARPGVLVHSLGATVVHQWLNQPCVRLMGTMACRHDAAPDAGNWKEPSLRKQCACARKQPKSVHARFAGNLTLNFVLAKKGRQNIVLQGS